MIVHSDLCYFYLSKDIIEMTNSLLYIMYIHTNLEEIETRQMSQMTLFLKDGIYKFGRNKKNKERKNY